MVTTPRISELTPTEFLADVAAKAHKHNMDLSISVDYDPRTSELTPTDVPA